MHLVIDGMNVIGGRRDGWWRDRDKAMAQLVDELERYCAATGDDVTVVFERPPKPPLHSSLVEIRHAPQPRPDAADFEIVKLLEELPSVAAVQVVTSDNWLADAAHAKGATVISSKSFRTRLADV